MTVGQIMTLARDLAHLTGSKQADVEVALQKGRFVAFAGVDQARVNAAKEQLRTMGAVAQIRPAEAPPELPRLEPDPDAAAGPGFGGPVASFSEADLGLDSSAFNTGPGVKPMELGLGPVGGGGGGGIGMVMGAEDARTNRYQPVPPGASMDPNASLSAEDMEELVAKLKRRGSDQAMDDLAFGLDASLGDPAVQTLDGMDGDVADAAESAAALEAQPVAVQRPTDPDAPLELDLDAPASLTPVGPEGAAVGRPAHLTEERVELPSPKFATPRAPANVLPPSASASMPRMPSGDMPLDRGLLFVDPVANALGCIAGVSLVCILLAIGVTRATTRDDVMKLEAEIEESYREPGDVKRGDLRAPSAVLEELDDKYGTARLQFLAILALGIPAGLGLGRIRR